jgi:hypothetical protein
VASTNPLFSQYAKTMNGQNFTLKLYKVGASNTEVALTYASFGEYWTINKAGANNIEFREFFVYGVPTPNGLIGLRTGSGQYEGKVYGAALNKTLGGTYDVTGTSAFNVNFDSDTMSGKFSLQATPLGASPALALGEATFSGPIRYWGAGHQEADLGPAGTFSGRLDWNFYGPTASEIAGSFQMSKFATPAAGVTFLSGVTIAKEK